MTTMTLGTAGRWRQPALGLLGLALVMAVVEALPRLGLVDRRFLPPFSAMVASLAEQLTHGDFWVALAQTLRGWALGLALAMLAGVVAGVVIGSIPFLRAITASTVEFLRPIPSVALIPLVVLIYGNRPQSALVLVVYAAFWQVLVQVLYGVADVDPVARETATSYRFGRLATLRYVVWPTTLPYLFTGVRLAASVALVLAITGELVIGTPGVGNLIANAQSSGATATMYALVAVTGVLGVLVNLLARSGERALLGWHPSVRRDREAA